MFSDLLIERGKAKKDAWLKENQKQLMNLENMNTFAQVYNLQVIASLGVRGKLIGKFGDIGSKYWDMICLSQFL